MSDVRTGTGAPGVYVFRQVGGDRWQLVGEAARRPGSPVPDQAAQSVQRLAEAGLPCLSLHSNPVDPADQVWLADRVPQAEVVVWPVRHHFPHLADPEAFARLLAGDRADNRRSAPGIVIAL